MPDGHPNVLLVLTDQQQDRAIGAIDDSFVTPALDRLADEGVVFTGCHCTLPQCSPSRSSLITGQYPHQTGMYTLPGQGPGSHNSDHPSVGSAFREAGYETAWFGKWHLGRDNIESLGWEVTGNIFPERDNRNGAAERLTIDEETTAHATEYLTEYSGDDPFFATVSFRLPHPPFHEYEEFGDLYDRDEISLPPNYDDDISEKPPAHRERIDKDLTAEEIREIRYQYRTMVSRVDHWVGQLIDALRDAGIYDDTIVVFTSDHGDMQGAHGMVKKGCLAYDEILRVPLLVRIPGYDSTRNQIDDLVSNAAVPGTLLDAAGLAVPDTFTGGSFLPALKRTAPPDDERVFFEHKFAFPGEHPYLGVRTRNWKYVEYVVDGAEELYDMTNDPLELNNIADDPSRDEIKTRLSEMIHEWWEETGGDLEAWETLQEKDPQAWTELYDE